MEFTQKKKIAICHYRVGGTDGVALEIAKRKEILERYGCEVKLIAGPRSRGADYTVKELEWDNGVVPIIKENGFVHFNRSDLSGSELKRKMNKICYMIEDRLNEIQEKENFDLVLIHNIFSFGGHIAAPKAFTKWIKKYKLPCLATHHDFYWERKEFNIPRNEYLRNYMEKFMPPRAPYIEHVVINSLAQRELKKRCGIEASVMPDVFDFSRAPWVKDRFNKNFLRHFDIKANDLIILQATRVIPRKAIELSIDFTKALRNKLNKLRGEKLYNGKRLSADSDVVLVIAGYAEDEKRDYLFKLKSKAFDDRVPTKFIGTHIKSKRKYSQGIKTFSLWDAYVYSDIVTFPSAWEGWGNQFIEAIFARKPILMHEYPVYKEDIKKEGYRVISLGNGLSGKDENDLYNLPSKNINTAVRKTIDWLTDVNLNKKLEHNFELGKKYHDYAVLEKFLVERLDLTAPEILPTKTEIKEEATA